MTDLLKTQKVFSIKAGDRLPSLKLLFVDHDGNPFDLTNYPDLFLVIAPVVGGRRIVDMGVIVRQAPYTAGRAVYDWQAGETIKPGEYHVEVLGSPNYSLPEADRLVISFPGASYGKLVITPRL